MQHRARSGTASRLDLRCKGDHNQEQQSHQTPCKPVSESAAPRALQPPRFRTGSRPSQRRVGPPRWCSAECPGERIGVGVLTPSCVSGVWICMRAPDSCMSDLMVVPPRPITAPMLAVGSRISFVVCWRMRLKWGASMPRRVPDHGPGEGGRGVPRALAELKHIVVLILSDCT